MPKRLFTQEHIEYLAANAAGRDLQELTVLFNEKFGLHLSIGQINGTMKYRKLNNSVNAPVRNRYTPEQIDYLMANVAGRSYRELTDTFNEHFSLQKSVKHIKNALNYRKLRSGTKRGHGHKYTQEQITFLEENVKGRSSLELTDMFNEHFNLHLKFSQIQDFKTIRGLRSGVRPNRIPILPLGTERLNQNGYIVVKTAEPNKWEKKHILIWEAANGPVPEDHVVIFGDRNKQNYDLDNMILVSKKMMGFLNLNKLSQYDAELTKTGITIANIVFKISERQEQMYLSNMNISKTCQECGKVYTDDQFLIYCSSSCRDKAYKAQQTTPKQYLKIDRSPYQHCIVCEKSIEQGTRGRIKKYCSRACRRIRNRALTSKSVSPVKQ